MHAWVAAMHQVRQLCLIASQRNFCLSVTRMLDRGMSKKPNLVGCAFAHLI